MGYMDVIRECQENLVEAYPDLKVRWIRIFGKRWAYLWGDSSEVSVGSPLKIEIKPGWGLVIDNTDIIPAEKLGKIIALIRERFSHVELV